MESIPRGSKREGHLFIYGLVAILCILLAGCNVNITQDSPTANSAVTTSNTGSGTQGLQVFVEPDAGYQVITNAISGAKQSVWVEMYLLTERHIIQDLEEAAHRGVDVRVMLEGHPYGEGSVSPTETLDRLNAA